MSATDLTALSARIDALEQQIAEQSTDNIQPNYLTINPDGTVSASFTGFINARGMTMPAASGSSPSPTVSGTSQIRWTKQSDGAYVAGIYGQENPLLDYKWLNLYAQPEAAGGDSRVYIDALDHAGDVEAELLVSNVGTPAVTASAGSAGAVKIIDSLGDSSFVQSPSLGGRLGIQAAVGSNGSISSGIWTNIAAAWPTPFTSIATATYGLIQGANGGTFHFMASITNAGASVNVYNDGNPPIGYEVFFIGFGIF